MLDTSSSMDGLIDQTRNQLWQVVNEFSRSKKNGLSPLLEVAVFEYGNDGLSSESGYLRQVSGLTRELDQVSESPVFLNYQWRPGILWICNSGGRYSIGMESIPGRFEGGVLSPGMNLLPRVQSVISRQLTKPKKRV